MQYVCDRCLRHFEDDKELYDTDDGESLCDSCYEDTVAKDKERNHEYVG